MCYFKYELKMNTYVSCQRKITNVYWFHTLLNQTQFFNATVYDYDMFLPKVYKVGKN